MENCSVEPAHGHVYAELASAHSGHIVLLSDILIVNVLEIVFEVVQVHRIVFSVPTDSAHGEEHALYDGVLLLEFKHLIPKHLRDIVVLHVVLNGDISWIPYKAYEFFCIFGEIFFCVVLERVHYDSPPLHQLPFLFVCNDHISSVSVGGCAAIYFAL